MIPTPVDFKLFRQETSHHLTIAPDMIVDDVEADFEILEVIGAHIEKMIEGLLSSGALQKTLRRWLVGHGEPPQDEETQECLMAMAADLEMFTPSMSGRTMVDRHLAANAAVTHEDKQAFQALGAAQFRLVKIVDIGLAGGITGKLAALKSARQSTGVKSSGFDLVAVKHAVVDEEVGQLGLSFTTRQSSSRRYVLGDAYAAGEAAGALFEPNAALVD